MSEQSDPRSISRRQFVKGAAWVVAGLGAAAFLEACGAAVATQAPSAAPSSSAPSGAATPAAGTTAAGTPAAASATAAPASAAPAAGKTLVYARGGDIQFM